MRAIPFALVLALHLTSCGDDVGCLTCFDSGGPDGGSTDATMLRGDIDVIDDFSVDLPPPMVSEGLWIDRDVLMALPTTGDAWNDLRAAAEGDWGTADVSDQDNDHDVLTFAGALVAIRSGDDALRMRVEDAIRDAIGTEAGGRTLALGRQLLGYVLAADLLMFREPAFVEWVAAVRTTTLDGRAGIDTLLASALRDPSNWGCHARASMVAAARYLGDDAQLAMLAERFHDYTGRDGTPFEFREDWWQAEPSMPQGINRVGTTIDGHSVDGVVPDDQRRAGEFAWPPPRENYVWESLQGTVAAAHLLTRAGYPAFEHQSRAVLRAIVWLHEQADFPATGDDRWVPWLVNDVYGTTFPTEASSFGKSAGFTDWTHAP